MKVIMQVFFSTSALKGIAQVLEVDLKTLFPTTQL